MPLPRLLWLLSFVIMLDGRTMVTILPDIAADLDVSVPPPASRSPRT